MGRTKFSNKKCFSITMLLRLFKNEIDACWILQNSTLFSISKQHSSALCYKSYSCFIPMCMVNL